jgi:response regulator NasT
MHASTGSERTTAAVAVRDIARVLIVADEPQAGAELGAVLVEAGFEVLGHAVDWCEAVAVATQVRPDLIVMAAGLPDTPGATVVQEISQRTIAPAVLLTEPSRTGLIGGALDAGAMACLVTPFVPATLLDAVEMVLRHADPDIGRAEAADLNRRLEERNLVERAKGLLMCHQQMTEARAYRWLQRTAMSRRVPVTRVATGVIDRWVD